MKEQHPGIFPTTRWSVIRSAKNSTNGERHAALNELCEIYWPALRAYAIAKGNTRPDAEDLTQGFLLQFLERDSIVNVRTQESRFRSYLLTAFQRYMTSEWRCDQAQKRGGGRAIFSLDDHDTDFLRELPDAKIASPEEVFERAWIERLLNHTLNRLRDEYRRKGKESHFATLAPSLELSQDFDYAAASQSLNRPIGTLRVYVQRLRREYQQAIRNELADTLVPGADVEAELRSLQACYRG